MLPPEDLAQIEHHRRTRLRLVIAGSTLAALILVALSWPAINEFLQPGSAKASGSGLALTTTPSPFLPDPSTPTITPTPTQTATPTAAAPLVVGGGHSLDGLIVVSLREQGYFHLFSHQLAGEPFTRLTYGNWDDIDPAISPNGKRVAFSSNRGGQWDIYLLDLTTGETTQLSDDAAYDGRPYWAANLWLAFEHDAGGNLEIDIQPADGSLEPIHISNSAGLDYAPAWRPLTQQVAFVSDRSGQPAIWVVNLVMEGPARLIQLDPESGPQNSPAWSPDGKFLAWSAQDADGAWRIYVTAYDEAFAPRLVGVGEEPRWSPTGDVILATVRGPNETYLTAYTLDGGLALAPEAMPGSLDGLAWGAAALPEPLPGAMRSAANASPSAAWADALSEAEQHSADDTAALNDVHAPFEELNEAAVAPFDALRQRAAQLLGWDALSSLENTFVPIDKPLPPSRQQDWLYTGRAFDLHSSLLGAGWLAVVREEFDGQTYWRVYLRTAAEETGFGRPLTERPWNFSARYNGNESTYQAGGKLAESVPGGYWIDFTALAADFGFERVPALSNWRNFFQGALFNQFVLRAGLNWEAAMLQLYSADAVATLQAQ